MFVNHEWQKDHESSAGLENSGHLSDHADRVADMLGHPSIDRSIEASRTKRQLQNIRDDVQVGVVPFLVTDSRVGRHVAVILEEALRFALPGAHIQNFSAERQPLKELLQEFELLADANVPVHVLVSFHHELDPFVPAFGGLNGLAHARISSCVSPRTGRGGGVSIRGSRNRTIGR